MTKYTSKLLVGSWIMMGVMTLALVLGFAAFRDYVNCANAVTEGQRARAEASQRSDAAVDRMVDGVLVAGSPGQTREALETYRAERREVERIRKDNPVEPKEC